MLTSDAFYADDRVTYLSLHQYPMYPGTGALAETGEGAGAGTTVNVPLPAGANHALPYGICAYQDVVMVMDVANSRLIRIEEDLATVVDLSAGSWIGPTFVTALGDNLVVADVRGNALLLLEPDGDGFLIADSLRGSPPDSVVPQFDSLGGVGS